MLVVKPKVSSEITAIIKKDRYIDLVSAKGILRIVPKSDNIARIMYTENGKFEEKVPTGFLQCETFINWTYKDSVTYTYIYLKALKIEINKLTSSIKYYDQNDKLILAEKTKDSHELIEFDSYKTVIDENTVIEEVDTPDGVKQIIKEATTVFDKKLYKTKLNLSFTENEKIYGLGQAEEGSLNLRGTTQYLHQANMKIAIPMFLSTNGYGILSTTASPAIFNDNAYGSYLFTEADFQMDFYIIAGDNFDKIVKGYRFLTGKAVMLPRWAFGFVQSQERYETQDEILQIASEYRAKDIGLDAIVLDWRSWEGEQWGQKTFDAERFPNPSEMTQKLHEIDVRFMISVWPNMREFTENYKEFLANGLLLPASPIYNVFDENARKMYWKQAYEGLFVHGIDSWWCDSSEAFLPEWRGTVKPLPHEMYKNYFETASKFVPAEVSNCYGLMHSITMYEGQRAVTEEKRMTNLTRSSYTGGQKYGTIMWSGDISATWDTLKNQIVAGLNFCATGLPYWTQDIGAFFIRDGERWFWTGDYADGIDDYGYRELFVRWFQYAVFLPIFRSHGTDERREMWLFDEPTHVFYDALKDANRLRYTLIPYIYSLAGKVYLDDYTMMRLLAFDYADDEKACEIKDQFMFGDILVCPVTEAMYYGVNSLELQNVNRVRKVYLPKGNEWYNYYTGKKYDGGQTIEVEVDLSFIPLFVKSGSIITKTKPLMNTTEVETAEIEVHVYSGNDCKFVLYEDSGDGYAYEKGEYSLTEFYWNDEDKNLTISRDEDRFKIVII